MPAVMACTWAQHEGQRNEHQKLRGEIGAKPIYLRANGGIACGVSGDAVPAQPRAEMSGAGRPGGVVAGKQPARRLGEAGQNGARGGLERELADQGGEPGGRRGRPDRAAGSPTPRRRRRGPRGRLPAAPQAVTPDCPSPLDRHAPLAAQALVTQICYQLTGWGRICCVISVRPGPGYLLISGHV
jgi:hypothetical protein